MACLLCCNQFDFVRRHPSSCQDVMTDAKDVCHTHNKQRTDEPTTHLGFHLKQTNGSTKTYWMVTAF
jgi:hypothetical protein